MIEQVTTALLSDTTALEEYLSDFPIFLEEAQIGKSYLTVEEGLLYLDTDKVIQRYIEWKGLNNKT
jgi:hypothetical protein